MALNGFDLVFLMLAFLSIAVGAWRGFAFECISVLGWVVGFFAAMALGPVVGQWLPGEALADGVRKVLGMVAVFILAVFLSSLLASVARASVKTLGMRAADRMVGAFFGFLRIALVGVAIAVIVHALKWQAEPWWQGSALGHTLNYVRLELAQALPNWKVLQDPQMPDMSLPISGAVIQELVPSASPTATTPTEITRLPEHSPQ